MACLDKLTKAYAQPPAYNRFSMISLPYVLIERTTFYFFVSRILCAAD